LQIIKRSVNLQTCPYGPRDAMFLHLLRQGLPDEFGVALLLDEMF